MAAWLLMGLHHAPAAWRIVRGSPLRPVAPKRPARADWRRLSGHPGAKDAARDARAARPLLRGTLVRLFSMAIGPLASTDPLAPFGPSGFRARWHHLLRALGVPSSSLPANLNLTPACLRGSGATDFYVATEDVPRVFWRGRRRQAPSAVRYLQAAAASNVLAALPDPVRAQVVRFASASDTLVASFLDSGPDVWSIQLAAARQGLVTSQGL